MEQGHVGQQRGPYVMHNSSEFAMVGESIRRGLLMPSWFATRLFPNLHLDRRNYLFADGHVESTEPWPEGKQFVLGQHSEWAQSVHDRDREVWARNNHFGHGPFGEQQ